MITEIHIIHRIQIQRRGTTIENKKEQLRVGCGFYDKKVERKNQYLKRRIQ